MKKFLKRLLGALVLLFVTILVTPFFIVFLAAIIGACVIGIALSPIIVYFLIASYGKEMIDKQKNVEEKKRAILEKAGVVKR